MVTGVLGFIKALGTLKSIARKGWVSIVGVRNPESVADHSFRTAVLAMCIGDLKGLNVEKLVRMALLHDVHEVLIGDLDHNEKKKIGKEELQRKEREAIINIFSNLPKSLQMRYRNLSMEFQEQLTEEAKFVRQIDQIEMIFQAIEYEGEGYDLEKLQVFWDSVEGKIEDDDLTKLLRILRLKELTDS